MLSAFTIAVMLCALTPAVLFCINLFSYRKPGATICSGLGNLPLVSVLIPARDEEGAIGAAVASILASTEINFEVLVMDDCSTDRTPEIVHQIAQLNPRVHLHHTPALPPGWNGKQHACWALAHKAKGGILCFVDADVRLQPLALLRMTAALEESHVALISGFPKQIAETWLEWLLLPLIHFVLLGFLPIGKMRLNTDPSFSAGCGQFMMVRREAYFASGSHAAIRQTMHDGLLLPRLLRQHGYRTDLADITDLATCRMYRNARQVWQGLAKNATEGIAAPVRILPISILLIMGQVLPFVFAIWLLLGHPVTAEVAVYVCVAVLAAWLPRALAAWRFHQSWRGAILHPVGILALLAVQWYAFTRKLLRRSVSWKERSYAGE
jgi:glycosyltransferase involved in cell wall biosynthesis